MFSTSEKSNNVHVNRQKQDVGSTFFRKADEGFFGSTESPSFFGSSIQPKLSVSSPDDPQEKEADAMADHVMRMPEPASPEKKEEGKVQMKEEEESVHPKLDVQSPTIQCKEEGKDKLHAKLSDTLHRSHDENGFFAPLNAEASSDNHSINRKNISLHHSDIIQCSGRGPPADSIQFEQSLSSSKGGGSALPADTRQFMESRFSADFSGVRIHTDSNAEQLSSSIHAQAFAHGSDIYFNNGKYSPSTQGGGALLAHELTHTIQQGASKTISSPSSSTSNTVSSKPISVSTKPMIHRATARVPQLTNAIAKAKSVEGKINAKKPGPDGYRTGWQYLLEIFKTTFGEDKIVSGAGGTSVPGTVSEMDIKKYRETTGATVKDGDPDRVDPHGTRDSMPSWCGIFVFWALNKSGVPMPKWKLGQSVIKPEAMNPKGYVPQPGDIAFRRSYSHFALVESVNGDTVKTVNGNTAGSDNMGGQVQTVEHKMDNWTAFFSTLKTTAGPLTSGEAPVSEKPKSLKDLRKELFNVDRKDDDHDKESNSSEEVKTQVKPELSDVHVNADGHLQKASNNSPPGDEKVLKKEEEKKEEDKYSATLQPSLQKKPVSDVQCKCDCNENDGQKVQSKQMVQLQTETSDSSLNSHTNAETSEQCAEHERGPPVQAKLAGKNIVQCSPVDDALSYVGSLTECITIDLNEAKKCVLKKAQQVAMHIPGYKALRVVLGEDPITSEKVVRNGRNFIEAAFDIMPGGELLYKKLDEQHQLDAAAAWLDGKIAAVETMVDALTSSLEKFWNDLGPGDAFHPLDVLGRGANIIFGFIGKVVDFAISTAKELLKMVKDYLLGKIVQFIKEKTTAYPLLTVILGKDPITEQKVERNGTNILNAMLEFGGEEGKMQRDQMKSTGTFQKVAAYIDEGIAVFGDLYDKIVEAFKNIWDYVGIDALMNPIATFEKIYNQFAAPVKRVIDFVVKVGKEILKLIKEVLFKRISEEAKKTRGYYLVTVLIGKDPFTGDAVPRSVENIIHGFMSLMEGGEEQFQQMKESGAIDKATAKVDAAVKKLNMTPQSIIQLFIDLWNSFTLKDFLHPIDTFKRIIAKFGEPILRLIEFVIEIVKIVVEVILIVMNFPFDLINNIITKAMMAFELIKKDPMGFLKNLLRAIKEGFMQFFDNILTHLFNGLKEWFLSEVEAAGIPIPTDFTVMGIIKWLLAVLDITMEKIWKKLEERIGKEKVDKIKKIISVAEKVIGVAQEAYQFMQDVQERGFMAVMVDKMKEQLSNVWELVLDAVKNFVMDQIIKKVTAKLLSMLDPTGIMAVINSAIALYKAIQSFIKYLRKMLEIVNSFVEGTLEIAQGSTKKAADFLERSLAKGIPIVIGFLANQVGLNLSEHLKEAVEFAREKVDKALTWVIDKVVGLVEKLVTMGKAAVKKVTGWLDMKKPFTSDAGRSHSMYFKKHGEGGSLIIESDPIQVNTFLSNRKKEIPKDASLDDAKKTAMLGKIATAEQLVEKIEELTYPKDKSAKPAETIELEILENSENLVALLKELDPSGSSEVIPAATFIPGFTNGMKAQFFEARYLSDYPKKNYEEGEDAGKYKGDLSGALTLLEKMGVRAKWVAFHIVNDNYGGKATDSNLVPAPQYINKDYRAAFEDKLKALLSQKHPVWMKFSCSYRGSTALLQSLSANGGGMKFENNQWVEDPALKVPQYSVTVDEPRAEKIEINSLVKDSDLWYFYEKETALEIASLDFLAAEVKKGVRFSNKEDIKTHMDKNFIPSTTSKGRRTTILGQIDKTNFSFT